MKIESQKTMGTSQVGDYVIRYEIKSNADGSPKELKGHIYDGVDIIATYNCAENGVMGFSINESNGLGFAVRRAIIEQMLDDTEQVFNEADGDTTAQ